MRKGDVHTGFWWGIVREMSLGKRRVNERMIIIIIIIRSFKKWVGKV